jgi:hypothetical protein
VSWDGEIKEKILLGSINFSPANERFPREIFGTFLTFSKNVNEGVFGIIFSNGNSGLIHPSLQVTFVHFFFSIPRSSSKVCLHHKLLQSLQELRGMLFGTKNGVCLSLNLKHQLAAIGCEK